jgi:alanyl-tRNA synthetase
MALFGEKYGDVVRVVEVPGVSMELCGGTHVRHTGEIGLLRIVSETGVAAGVRRIEAQTGPGAYRYFLARDGTLREAALLLRTSPEGLVQRAGHLLEERTELEALLAAARRGGGGGEDVVREAAVSWAGGPSFAFKAVRLLARDPQDARAWGDGFLETIGSGVGLLVAEMPDGKRSLFSFVTDDLVSRGLRADAFIREVAGLAGGKGGGRPHMAQAGVSEPEKLDAALGAAEGILRRMAGPASS